MTYFKLQLPNKAYGVNQISGTNFISLNNILQGISRKTSCQKNMPVLNIYDFLSVKLPLILKHIKPEFQNLGGWIILILEIRVISFNKISKAIPEILTDPKPSSDTKAGTATGVN